MSAVSRWWIRVPGKAMELVRRSISCVLLIAVQEEKKGLITGRHGPCRTVSTKSWPFASGVLCNAGNNPRREDLLELLRLCSVYVKSWWVVV